MLKPIRTTFLLSWTAASLLSGCNETSDKGTISDCDTGDCIEDSGAPQDFYDEGCTTVDGAGGYLWINDAIAVAEEGSEIHLCASDSGHEEAVVVDKAVTLIGPGAENYTLIAPTNEAGLLITADGASVSGISVDSTRSGVEVDAAAGVSLDAIQVLAAGNWGVKATDATDLSISNSVLMANGYGGIRVDGGSVSVATTDLSGNTGYGALATGDGELTLSESIIASTAQDATGDGSDGVGIRV